MPTIKRCAQLCIIGLLVSATDIFSADDSDSDSGLTGCADRFGRDEKTFSYTFAKETQGWRGDFADYPEGQASFYELTFDHRPLLPDLDPN